MLDSRPPSHIEPSYVDVDQLDPGLAESGTPYDPISFDPTVGKTTLNGNGTGKKLNVILEIDTDAARQAMIDRLRDGRMFKNTESFPGSCGENVETYIKPN